MKTVEELQKGDKVRCIDGERKGVVVTPGVTYPETGEIYTIRGRSPLGLLYLEEIHNPVSRITGREISFSNTRFEPVDVE